MQNILITGYPGVGKTTLINNLVATLNKTCMGMVTNEIREKGKRTGFKIETISGLEFPLASKHNQSSRYRVASYGVYLESIDKVIEHLEKEIQKSNPEIIVIDEIGKMELFSNSFKKFLEYCLDNKLVLGTIMLRDNNYTRQIKERLDTVVFHLTRENRKTMEEEIMEMLK
ncbi:MAG: NTPase [Candidatus Heimdallarchaeota archaeon]|nr:NTPase [Candidatus Heimdallarchaeota archaeon]